MTIRRSIYNNKHNNNNNNNYNYNNYKSRSSSRCSFVCSQNKNLSFISKFKDGRH